MARTNRQFSDHPDKSLLRLKDFFVRFLMLATLYHGFWESASLLYKNIFKRLVINNYPCFIIK
jgi:hypothetical protein